LCARFPSLLPNMRLITFIAALIAVSASVWAQNKGMVTLSNGTVRTDRTTPLTFTNPLILSTMTNSNAMNAVFTPAGQISNSTGVPSGAAASNSLLRADGAASSAWVADPAVAKVKASDFVRTNASITYSNDNELTGWTIDANSLYSVTIWLPHTSTTNSGFKAQFTVPALATNDANYGQIHVESGGAVALTGASNSILPLATRTQASAGKNFVGRFFFRTGTNSGTMNLQWAPAVGGAGTNTNTTTLSAGATVVVTKLAP
jgi:hypothetical protein